MSQKQYKQTKLPVRFRKKKSIDLTFYLDRNGVAAFKNTPMVEEKYLFQIKWPEINQLLNVSCHPSMMGTLQKETGVVSKKLESTWASILKSHLQKAVRRQETSAALATAQILMEHEPISLLRRLPIIVVEDTYLFLEYPTLIWLMIYYTQYPNKVIGDRWKRWILSVVRNLCDFTPWKDQEGAQSDFYWNLAHMNEDERSLIYALQLRKIYGGMKCDQKMLNWFSFLWTKRFLGHKSNEIHRNWPLMTDLEIEQIPVLKSDNFLIAGIDFHPCPWLVKDIQRNYPEFSEEIIRETIWHLSSGVNVRTLNTVAIQYPDLVLVWDTIQDDWILICQKVLHSYLSK